MSNKEEKNPLLCHWADQMAEKIIHEKGDLDLYTCASGITPSGTVHIGNFREIITVDLIVRALEARGKKVRFIYSWDDYDVFRKVPANMPDPEILQNYLRYPITMVPDTTKRNENYARHHEVDIETQLPRVGIHPVFLYQAERYRANRYVEGMKKALQNKELIKECLNEYRDDAHKMKAEDEYWPVAVFCSKCNKDTTKIKSYDGEYGISYECECGNCETADLRTFKGAKLGWRVDWPMRWNEEKVVFEPGGKDHISPGGSYDTAKLVSKKIYDWDAPVTMRYDFVSLKGVPGKMSSSKGKVISLVDALEVYQPQVLRYIFAGVRPNTEFSISFDLDVLKTYEDYDKTERIVYGVDKVKNEEIFNKEKRIYMLSQIDGKIKETMPYQIPFRLLTTLLQIHSGNVDEVIAYLGDVKPEQEETFRQRAACAWFWITEAAPTCAEEFCFALRNDGKPVPVTKELAAAVKKIREDVVPKLDGFQTDKDCQQAIYEVATALSMDTKVLFTGLYNVLINKDQGPRLGSFFRIIGKERLEKILSLAVADENAAATKNNTPAKKLTPAEIDKLPLTERFSKRVILKVSRIEKVEQHPGGTQLYILTLNTGDSENRQIVSSIVPFYKPEELTGKNIVLVYNLKPANFRGVRSNGMLLAATDPAVTDKETCEVIFAPQFEVGTVLEPEGFLPPEEELCFVKPEKFAEMSLSTKDGFVEIDGKKIGSGGKYLTVETYKNGKVK